MIPQTPDIMQSPLCYEGDKRNIPADTPLGTNQLSYKQGFPPITSIDIDAGGIAPERQDMNAALNLLSIHTYFLQSGNKYKYSDLLDYEIGSTVLGSDNSLYYCIQANGATTPNTVQDPTTSSGYWNLLITEDGKFNAENLSVTLGAFALLNNIPITDSKITGNLPASRVSDLARVATSGSYNDLSNRPTIPTNFPPRPIKGTGTALGVWRVDKIGSATSTIYRLPDGGTWAWFSIINVTLKGGVGRIVYNSGVDSGGTIIADTSYAINRDYNVLLWRIQ